MSVIAQKFCPPCTTHLATTAYRLYTPFLKKGY
jgi:hypothetical protein